MSELKRNLHKMGVSYDEYRIAEKLNNRGDFGPWYKEYKRLMRC